MRVPITPFSVLTIDFQMLLLLCFFLYCSHSNRCDEIRETQHDSKHTRAQMRLTDHEYSHASRKYQQLVYRDKYAEPRHKKRKVKWHSCKSLHAGEEQLFSNWSPKTTKTQESQLFKSFPLKNRSRRRHHDDFKSVLDGVPFVARAPSPSVQIPLRELARVLTPVPAWWQVDSST